MSEASSEFRVYLAEKSHPDFFNAEGLDISVGVLGALNPTQPPLFVGTDLGSAEMFCKQHLGVEPADFLYITDDQFRVRQTMINRKHHAAVDKAFRWTGLGYGLLMLCFACLAASPSNPGPWPLVFFLAAALLYTVCVVFGLFNEVEGLMFAGILLLLASILLPTLMKFYAHHHASSP